ncbi:MAG: phosphoglycolate phosphatase [Bryobacterales bacterium]|nr:phosphoglycolate phosphatase [Bryobacterales bacterium]
MRRTGPYHRQALVDAVRIVTGLDTTTEGIPVHGMLDPDILTLMLQSAGYADDQIRKVLPAIFTAAEDVYEAAVPELRDRCCPGVPPLLAELHERRIPVALVTGNLTRIGWRKLERAGLHHFFRFGAFGEMAATRGGLARLAIERARSEGLIDGDANISLIGDAPQDVRAAQENRIQSIAVRTGITPPGDLEACRPDYLLDDLTQLHMSII